MQTDGHDEPPEARPDLPIDADAEAVFQARHDLLTQRDHTIGLEAEAANLQQTVYRMTARQKAQKERIEEIREKLTRQRNRADRLQRELDILKAASAKPARRLLPRRDAD